MAEGLLRKMAADSGLSLEVLSAGLAAFPGVPVAPEAVEAGKEKGFDLTGHQSQPLSKPLVLDSDLILTMTLKHKEMITKKMPDLAAKVFTLSELAGQGTADVEDPVGQPLDAYRKALDQVEGYLRRSLDRLKTL